MNQKIKKGVLNMKNLIFGIMMTAAIFVTENLAAQSVTGKNEGQDQSTQVEKQQVPAQAGPNFTDKNNDGICDNRPGRGNRNRNFIDTDNDGICDNFTNRSGRANGRNFVDTNNDGICDRFEGGRKGQGCGNGKGFRHRNGQR